MVWPNPRAAQTANPVEGDAQEGSESTTVVPIETAFVHAAQAGYSAQSTTIIVSRRRTHTVFIFAPLCEVFLNIHRYHFHEPIFLIAPERFEAVITVHIFPL